MRVQSWLAISAALYIGAAGCMAELSTDTDDSFQSSTGGTTSSENGGEVVTLPGGLKLEGKPEYFRLVRLTHDQWENSVRDVLLLSAQPGLSSGFFPDAPEGIFTNDERALEMTDTLRVDYQRSAESVAEMVATDPAALAKLGAAGDSAGIIASVGRRAFRRDLTAQEQAAYATLWASGATFYQSGDAFADGARIFIEALLQAPDFLYQIVLSPDKGRLSGSELATRISYLLRNTTPSDELLNAAASGALDTDAGLASVVAQMLEEDGARLAIETFHRELFGLDRYQSIQKSATAFPAYTEELNSVLRDADLLFFSYVYGQNLGFREILTSDVAFVNQATAGFYGVPSTSPQLTQTLLDGSRPGFLTRLGFLAYNANLSEPDPIHRGVDINNKLLCSELSPPPGVIPPLPAPIPGQTNRERVTAHTGQGFCGSCHNEIINPPGFALESFDALGQFRTTDNGKPVDTTGTFATPSGAIAFSNVVELTTQLAENSVAHSCYAAHLAQFALGREIGAGDSALVTNLQEQSLDADASIKAMLLTMITSPEFTSARSGAQ